MKARLFFYVVIIVFITSCSGSKKVNKENPSQSNIETETIKKSEPQSSKYIPEELRNLYFGMPFTEFFSQYQAVSVSEIMSFRKSVELKNYSSDIKELTLYFDNDGNAPLYEFIIEYKERDVKDKTIENLYGKPNFQDKEWKFDSGEGYFIRIWTFDTKIAIAAFLPNTEWNE
ncbi:MAG: hypothetical protein JXB49_10410 [Bacteroidales bacterium]|nr:hypothetical protein [Bacteroidales bacterium]